MKLIKINFILTTFLSIIFCSSLSLAKEKSPALSCIEFRSLISAFEMMHANLTLPSIGSMESYVSYSPHDKDTLNKSLIFLKMATLFPVMSDSENSSAFKEQFDFELILNAIEEKMEDRERYFTEEEFLNLSPAVKDILFSLKKWHMEKKDDMIYAIKITFDEESPYTEGFDEDFIFRVYYNLFRSIYFRKKAHSYAAENFLNFKGKSYLDKVLLKSELEELKNALYVSNKLNETFFLFTKDFSDRHDINSLELLGVENPEIDLPSKANICSEIYKTYSKLSEKNYQITVFIESTIIERASSLKIPTEKPNKLENPKTQEELIQIVLNDLQIMIYNGIQSLKNPSLEEKNKS